MPAHDTASSARADRPLLCYVVTEDWYFRSHREVLAQAALRDGYEVLLVTRVGQHGPALEAAGIRVIAHDFHRGSSNPLHLLGSVLSLWRVYRRQRPVLVHHVALQPVIAGGIAAGLARVPAVVNALGGLGFLVARKSAPKRLLARVVAGLMRRLLNRPGTRTIVQNREDQQALAQRIGVDPVRLELIRGAGVDIERFHPVPEPAGGFRLTMVSRMLWEKGVADLVESLRRLQARGRAPRVWLVGQPDPHNRGSIPERQLREWQAEGLLEWLGQRDDIPALWAASHAAVLPTYYGEGIPKSLLEAGACGRPLIATDHPGCRDVVLHERTGLRVPVRDPAALADAIERLMVDARLRQQLGAAARDLVAAEFSEQRVLDDTLALYRRMLNPDGAQTGVLRR